MDLRTYHVVLINTSAGKDSLAMLDHVYSLALAQEAAGRLQAVHCDLGRMEWAGTRELAEKQCALYGVIARYQSLPGSSVARRTARDVAVFHNALLHQRSQARPGIESHHAPGKRSHRDVWDARARVELHGTPRPGILRTRQESAL